MEQHLAFARIIVSITKRTAAMFKMRLSYQLNFKSQIDVGAQKYAPEWYTIDHALFFHQKHIGIGTNRGSDWERFLP